MRGINFRPTKKEIIFSVLATIIPLILIAIGGLTGYMLTIRNFRNGIIHYAKGQSLGNLLSEKEKIDIASAYYEGVKIVKDINNFSWSVPIVMSPFVGHGCSPGKHNNATINSMQFRNAKELTIPKPSNKYRIFITGGSTAFSSGAPRQDRTIAGYLSRFLNDKLASSTKKDYEVFTMATPAWASTHERIIIENRLSELNPDLVISFSGNNDVHWGALCQNIFWFRSYADELYWDLIKNIYKISVFENLPDVVHMQKNVTLPLLVAERLEKNVKLSSYVLSFMKVPYIFCLQPTLAVTKKKLTKRESNNRGKDSMEYFLKCYKEIDSRLSNIEMDNFYYCNLSDIFDYDYADDEIFLDSYHFGDKGNEIIAKKIFHHIQNINVMIPMAFSSRTATDACKNKEGGRLKENNSRGISAPTSQEIHEKTYLKEILVLLKQKWPMNRTVNIVCHGHSVPLGYSKDLVVDTFNAYPHLLHQGLKKRFAHAAINVIVTAIGGEASASGAKRFEKDVLLYNPDIVIIDYALNDRDIGLEQAKIAWCTMIEQAKARGIKVILLTPTVDIGVRLDDPNALLNKHAEQIRNLAQEHHVALVDCLALFQSYVKGEGQLQDLMSQRNHPNRTGHEVVTKGLLQWFPE